MSDAREHTTNCPNIETSTRFPDNASSDIGQLGPYRLLEELGAGGMGTVYKALHTKLDRIVAVKVLVKNRLNDADAVARFEREIKAVGRLVHPHIVHATDADEDSGVHYLVMEFVDGMDLSTLGQRLGPLPAAEACELIRQAAVGLQYIHEHGLVHRDIKPSNLMLYATRNTEVGMGNGDAGNSSAFRNPHSAIVKILDLGLALLGEESGERELTSTGQVMGTIDYMAPEQFENTHGVDIRADIYSLGGTLYKLLTGQAAFSGEKYGSSLQKLAALARDDAPSVSTHRNDLPAKLVAIIDRMLARNPARRFQSPGEVADALASFAGGADLVGLWQRVESAEKLEPHDRQTALSRTSVASRGARRTRAIVGGVATLLLVIGLFAMWAAHHFRDRPESDIPIEPGPLAVQPKDGARPYPAADTARSPTTPAPSVAPFDKPEAKASTADPHMVTLPNGWQIGEPVNLGPIVNSQWNDSNPTVTADGLTLVFGSSRPGRSQGLWMSTRTSTDEPWGEPVKIGSPVDDSVSRFGAAISADGLTLLISSSRPGGIGAQDIWQSTRTDDFAPWTEPVHLGPVVNSSTMEVAPSLSDDGLTLLFASDRPDGGSGSSIWMAMRRSVDGPWGEPVKLGPVVNTSRTEGSPGLSSDGLALVFESGRAPSIGVGDLWMCTRSSSDESWGEPVNLGPQVNSSTWDAGPAFGLNDTTIYFSSRRPKGDGSEDGDSDIWTVPIKRPNPKRNEGKAMAGR